MIYAALLCLAAASAAFAQDAGFHDNFETRRLDSGHFSLWEEEDASIVNMGTRGLTIMSRGDSPAESNAVYFTASDPAWEAEANVVLYPTSQGGLVLMTDRDNYWGVSADYRSIYVWDCGKVVKTARNPYGRHLHLKLVFAGGELTVWSAPQKSPWSIVENGNPTVERLPADRWTKAATIIVEPGGATADRISLLAMKKDVVSFRDFWYRVR